VPHEAILPGIWRFRLGEPESVTPVSTRRHQPKAGGASAVNECPVPVTGRASDRGYRVSIPLGPHEQVYGFGLQLQSFTQRGLKKTLRVNADPQLDSGDTHAPAPFYVTTAGYGVLVDTARYATFYCGSNQRDIVRSANTDETLPAAYRAKGLGAPSDMLVEVPLAAGVDVYVFAGPSMRQAIARYNLFAGGGALPPPWGLGVWYRAHIDFTQDEVLDLAGKLRERHMPCDVIGLEPGWQTRSYSCSYLWSERFPDPGAMIEQLRRNDFRLNLWEHAFVHPDSPIHEAMQPHSGDFRVWGGLVPDFCGAPATELFADLHRREHVAIGVSGYKLDECDNSDYTGSWSFPELTDFPSGVDGEQMHSLFGLRYMDAIGRAFDGQRTYGLVRSSHALAAPYPYVLYSDLYNHREFVRALANSGFSGLLWTPELRDARDIDDLVRRLQTAVLSPMALINAWYIRNPPWLQTDRKANNAGEFPPDWEQAEDYCRQALRLRMRLVPYLHAAFVRYQNDGVPPFRALVVDYPDDPETWSIDDQYLMGEAFLVAPLFAGETERGVYLPTGDWFDFWTGTRYAGGQRHQVGASLETIPLFVRSGSAVPLAEPTDHVVPEPAIEVRAYGPDAPDSVTIYHDDGAVVTPVDLHRDDSWVVI
jgi:alpha-D-xyloside xylohydrolase